MKEKNVLRQNILSKHFLIKKHKYSDRLKAMQNSS